MSKPVPGDPAKDAALREWIKNGKLLLAKAEMKNYDRDMLLDLQEFADGVSSSAGRFAYYRLEQAVKGR